MLFISTFFLAAFGCVLESSPFDSEDIEIEKSQGLTAVGNDFYLIQEESCEYFKVRSSGRLYELSGQCDYDDLNAVFQYPDLTSQTDSNPILIACRKNNKKCVQLGTNMKYTVQDGGDGCHDSVNWVADDLEAAFGIYENGTSYMVGLIGSKLITYEFKGSVIESIGCTSVSIDFTDFSGISVLGEDVVISSKTSNQLWIGSGNQSIPFEIGSGQTFQLTSQFERISGVVLQSVDNSTGNVQGVLSGDHNDVDNALFRFEIACTSENYYASPMSSCAFEDQYLLSKAECEEAAAELGLSDLLASEISSDDRVRGCYYKDLKLWFNSDISGPTSTDNARASICEIATTTTEMTTQEPVETTEEITSTDLETTVVETTLPELTLSENFYVSNTSSCEFEDQYITSKDDCEAAAVELNLFDDVASQIENDDRVRGCYYKDSKLWFNIDASGPASDDLTRSSICILATMTTEEPIQTTEEVTTTVMGETTTEITLPELAISNNFYVSNTSSCEFEDQYITSKDDCEAAAMELNLFDDIASQIENDDRVRGCYYKDSTLWFNVDTSGPTSDDSTRSSICILATMTTELTTEEIMETTEEEVTSTITDVQETDVETTLPELSMSENYYVSSTSSCEFDDQYITSKDDCEAAAIELNLFDDAARQIENDDRVRGCYYKDSKLWFNVDTSGPTSDDLTRSSICMLSTVHNTVDASTTEESTLVLSTTEESTLNEETTALSTQESEIPTTEETTNEPETSAEATEIIEPSEEIGETTSELTTSEAPGFSLSAVSRCRTLTETVITLEECTQAAQILQLDDITVQEISNVDRPYGCYFKSDAKQGDGKLWLNTHFSIRDYDDSRQSLCHGDGAMLMESFATKLNMFGLLVIIFLLL
jgi:hypothetical protein